MAVRDVVKDEDEANRGRQIEKESGDFIRSVLQCDFGTV